MSFNSFLINPFASILTKNLPEKDSKSFVSFFSILTTISLSKLPLDPSSAVVASSSVILFANLILYFSTELISSILIVATLYFLEFALLLPVFTLVKEKYKRFNESL